MRISVVMKLWYLTASELGDWMWDWQQKVNHENIVVGAKNGHTWAREFWKESFSYWEVDDK